MAKDSVFLRPECSEQGKKEFVFPGSRGQLGGERVSDTQRQGKGQGQCVSETRGQRVGQKKSLCFLAPEYSWEENVFLTPKDRGKARDSVFLRPEKDSETNKGQCVSEPRDSGDGEGQCVSETRVQRAGQKILCFPGAEDSWEENVFLTPKDRGKARDSVFLRPEVSE
ncbi:hypothetical protein DPEC_G00361630 [Dallia pectoralis]|nr:hypothetical protein DPEC_G00361630 [Dallia pectoralis]